MEPQKDLMSSDSILVIAVRGTHGSVDHMVNLNERMEDASRDDFIVSCSFEKFFLGSCSSRTLILESLFSL